MHFLTFVLAIAASHASIVFASPHGKPAQHSPSTSTLCYTERGAKPGGHTSWITTYTPCTLTATVTTSTTTTLVAVTGTVTLTATSTSSIASTSTVPAPDGFVPVQSSLPSATYSANGPDPVNKREADLSLLNTKRSSRKSSGLYGTPKHPGQCVCKKWAPKPCSTTTTTTTYTSTVTPGPSYTTTTTTITVTSVTSSTTVYAACATNNFADGIVGEAAGQGFSNVIPPQGGAYPAYEDPSANTAYDCCVAGLLGPDGGIIFAFGPNGCIIGAVEGTCPATGQSTAGGEVAILGDYTFIVGNLPCGEITSSS